MASEVETNSFPNLFVGQTLMAEGDAVFAQDGGDTRLGDVVGRTYQLRGFACLVVGDDVGNV
ncbi:hypothetical protein [Mycobacteroides abscessus]|uniref:hypothetical protein n=1 Tax=Mycobacteroides abscessus TaxID=36809 RepID=UPI0012FFF2BF|nr:hypothetical protein [Mycobacteroides abscessus]